MENNVRGVTRVLVFLKLIGATSMVFAADGWALLLPPQVNGVTNINHSEGSPILVSNHLSNWFRFDLLANKAQCESTKDRLISKRRETFAGYVAKYEEALDNNQEVRLQNLLKSIADKAETDYDAALLSRCVRDGDTKQAHHLSNANSRPQEAPVVSLGSSGSVK